MQPLHSITEDFNSIVRPKDVFKEVKEIILLVLPDFNFDLFTNVYDDIVNLFKGEFFGYRKCNTGYHDLRHTEGCVLEMARIIHGASLNSNNFHEKDINLGLISATMHDTGYIQTADDDDGTGGKFTIVHIDRSIEFMMKYLLKRGFSSDDYQYCKNCLKCTGMDVKVADIHFLSPENELMGKILGTADLIGQMSDPLYLEKLPILFEEFQEADVKTYENEFEFLKKTPDFWEFTQDRFVTELGSVDRYLRDHFRVRWGVDRDLDRESIEKNINDLKYILEHHPTDYHRYLQRQEVTVGH